MKKSAILKLKSIFGSKKGKRQQEQYNSTKSSRSVTPDLSDGVSPRSETYKTIQRTPPPSRLGPPPSPPVPTKPVAPVAPEPSGPLRLMPCAVCGRTFQPQSLSKHVKICEKTAAKRRKTFDSSRQRREGTDLEQYLPKNFGLPENSPFLEKSPPNTAKAIPKPKPQSTRTVMKPAADLQKCPHCSRAFGLRAFERHVEWCADKAKILPAAPTQHQPHITDAKQRLNARTQYKAPLTRTRRGSSQSREKSSNSRSASVDSSRGISPPQEYGDYKHSRSRASESASSNDHEESPHVPVIRNSRASTNKSSGDANVKARQARLARDLSSTRNVQENNLPPLQQATTEPELNKRKVEKKPKPRLNIKKKHQLKKLEEITEKHKERSQKILTETKTVADVTDKSEHVSKSLIPIPHKKKVLKKAKVEKVDKKTSSVNLEPIHDDKTVSSSSKIFDDVTIVENEVLTQSKHNDRLTTSKTKNDKFKRTKESTISLDSLEEPVDKSKKDINCQSVGINTELLCPCIPCVIHDTSSAKIKNSKGKPSRKVQVKADKQNTAKLNTNIEEKNDIQPTVELLYKNMSIVSSCDIAEKISDEDTGYKDNRAIELNEIPTPYTNEFLNDKSNYIDDDNKTEYLKSETNVPHQSQNVSHSIHTASNLSGENENNFSDDCKDNYYEHDLSEENFEDDMRDEKNDDNGIVSRHGSGDTYTKFIDNPDDLQEFLTLTDEIITDNKSKNILTDKDVQILHTPETNSVESINKGEINDVNVIEEKHNFSQSFEELKNNFKELIQEANQNSPECVDNARKVRDLEHITMYELKFYEQNENQEKITPTPRTVKKDCDLKLPSIKENNKSTRKITRNKNNKDSYNYKMQNRSDKDYQTYIINKDHRQESSDEAPPLKLPRIDLKRLDDNYDPFACAARQMKELMSSDTNIPKKVQNSSKDSNRTLPTLKPTQSTKSMSHLRPYNTKILKDTLNKTYQKTPTLHRMKSFGSSNYENNTNTFSGRCSSFRLNRNAKKPNLNNTFTKSSKENLSVNDKTHFSRSSNLNRSFSSYNSSVSSTPKLKEKIPKLSTSMHHGFQRNTTTAKQQSVKLERINKEQETKNFVNLEAILSCDNSSMTDSNYIDPRLINENDNLPINVNTILNNPDMISSLESLLTTENLPAKFESFSTIKNSISNVSSNALNSEFYKNEKNNKLSHDNVMMPIVNDLSSQYNKMITSLEHSIASKTSIRDDDSLCEDFDLEEFMTSFDEEVNKQKNINKRICSATTRIVKQSELSDSPLNFTLDTDKVVNGNSNGVIPINKSLSLVFSSNNIVSEKLFPSSVKRSTSFLDSIQKKSASKTDTKNRQKTDQLDDDIMQSLKEFDNFYESQKTEKSSGTNKTMTSWNKGMYTDTLVKKDRKKSEQKNMKCDVSSNGHHTPNGKSSNDSAYSSLNRVSPSKLSLCNIKDANNTVLLEQVPRSDTSDSHKEDRRSISSEEFLAMERSTEIDEPIANRSEIHSSNNNLEEKRTSSRTSVHRSTPSRRPKKEALSSSGSETSLHCARRESHTVSSAAPRLSRFCHECGSKFPVDTAKFCIECGVKRLAV